MVKPDRAVCHRRYGRQNPPIVRPTQPCIPLGPEVQHPVEHCAEVAQGGAHDDRDP